MQLPEGGDFVAVHSQLAIKFIRCKPLQITTFRQLDFSLCYQPAIFLVKGLQKHGRFLSNLGFYSISLCLCS